MLDQFEIRTDDMPTEMQSLLREYPVIHGTLILGFAKRPVIGWARTGCSDN